MMHDIKASRGLLSPKTVTLEPLEGHSLDLSNGRLFKPV